VDAVTGAPLTGDLAAQSARVRAGIAEVQATGDLHGKPTLIVAGRNDALIPVNHASRAYLGLNAAAEGSGSKLRYIEVTNANHFDAFASALPTLIVPLHVYLFRALDAAFAHLKSGAALPPSQVVRTVTRTAATTPITNTHVPPLSATPEANAISVSGTTVDVPN
jgi:hydroxybutyrate-dimer hydrolase